jgi:leader peptidase (prepilin peptidase)/N-methyltransferase
MTLDHLYLIFVTAVGACVGSFLNVVIYRLPAGQSIVKPPSSCPHCGHQLKWYENVPVLAWFYLGGKCRKCKTPISFQYPLVEATTALLFGGWYFVAYFTDLQPAMQWWGVTNTWPLLVVQLALLAGLVAATLIDARHYIIPLRIPWLVTAMAIVGLPVAAGFGKIAIVSAELPPMSFFPAERLAAVAEPFGNAAAVRAAIDAGREGAAMVANQPWTFGAWTWAGIGGMAGLAIAIVLLRLGVLPQSFADDPLAHDQVGGESDESPEAFLAYPHARREMVKELAFVALPIVGAVVGYLVMQDSAGPMRLWINVLGGVLIGYLVGGGVVWATRILGTLGFGKEAMGLGDVHLMAAVGAVAGWQVAVAAFFIAPFFGLTWAAVSAGASKLLKREVKVIPYGPHLAAAAVLVMVFREPVMYRLAAVMGL